MQEHSNPRLADSRLSPAYPPVAQLDAVLAASFNAAELDVGYEGAFPFLTEQERSEH